MLLTDTPPQRTDTTLYACRDWIEQGFRDLKRAGWQWQRTRRTGPARSPPRRLSLLRQGMACLGTLLAQERWWTRLWLRPRPGPYGPAAVRALAQGP